MLQSEVFVSEDRQLRAVHLILDFEPLLDKFQDVGNAIRVSDPWLAWIDVSVSSSLLEKTLCKLTCLLIALLVKWRF